MLKKQHIIKAVFSILQTIIDLDYHILKGFRASFTKHMPVQILKKHEQWIGKAPNTKLAIFQVDSKN